MGNDGANSFAFFDMWDETVIPPVNRIVPILNTLTDACKLYPTFKNSEGQDNGKKIYEGNYQTFSEKLGSVLNLFKAIVGIEFDDDNYWSEKSLSYTPDLWNEIISEIRAINAEVGNLVTKITATKDCVIPSVASAISALSVAIDDLLTNLNGRKICSHIDMSVLSLPNVAYQKYLDNLSDSSLQKLSGGVNFSALFSLTNLADGVNLTELTKLFEDPCASSGKDYCLPAAKYIIKIHEKILTYKAQIDVKCIVQKVIDSHTGYINNKNIKNYLSNMLNALTGQNDHNYSDLPAITHRYGTCAQLLESIEEIAHLVPIIHDYAQHFIIFDLSLAANEDKFDRLLECMNELLVLFKEKNCDTCNSEKSRFNNISTNLTNLIRALTDLKTDIHANQHAKVIVPLAQSLAEIRRATMSIMDASFSGNLTALYAALETHKFGMTNGFLDEVSFLKDVLNSVLIDQSELYKLDTLPTFESTTSTIKSYVKSLHEFIREEIDYIFKSVRLMAQQTVEHYDGDTARILESVIGMLPHWKAALLEFANENNVPELVACAHDIDSMCGPLNQWLISVNNPACIAEINRNLYAIQIGLLNFAKSDSSSDDDVFPDLSELRIQSTNYEITKLLDYFAKRFIGQGALPDVIPTALPATINNVLDAFAELPKVIYEKRLTYRGSGEVPQWVTRLKSFQHDAFLFWRGLCAVGMNQFCGHDEYKYALEIVENRSFEQLNLDINSAIKEYEMAVHESSCEVRKRLFDAAERLNFLLKKIKSLYKGSETFDAYLVRIESSLASAESSQNPTTQLDYVEETLALLNIFIDPSGISPDGSQPKLMLQETLLNENLCQVAHWFFGLASESAWEDATARPNLGALFQLLSNNLRLLAPTGTGSMCDVCVVGVWDFFETYMATIHNICDYCSKIAELCAVCHPCKKMAASTFAVAKITKDLVEYSANFPNYGTINNVVEALKCMPEIPESTLSCDDVATVNSLCTTLLKELHIAVAVPESPQTSIPSEGGCNIIETACTRICNDIVKIVDKMELVKYQSQAPPTDTWESIDVLANEFAIFLTKVTSLFSKIAYCEVCDRTVIAFIIDKIKEQIFKLLDCILWIKEQWNQYQDYNGNTEFLNSLSHFYNIQGAIDAYIRSNEYGTEVAELVDRLAEWGGYLSKFTTIADLESDTFIESTIKYSWTSQTFLTPTRDFIFAYVNEKIIEIPSINAMTLRYIKGVLNDIVTNFDCNTAKLTRRLTEISHVFSKFIEEVSKTQLAKENGISVDMPFTFTRGFSKVIAIFDEIIRDLNSKPSRCNTRVNVLGEVEDMLLTLRDQKTSIGELCRSYSDAETNQGTIHLFTEIMNKINSLTKESSTLSIPTAICLEAEVKLSKINSILREILNNSFDIIHNTDWPRVDPGVVIDYQSYLRLLHQKFINLLFNPKTCSVCDSPTNDAYAAERDGIIRNIAKNILDMHDKLDAVREVVRAKELSVVASFCVGLSDFFSKKVQDKSTRDVNAFARLVDLLKVQEVQSWLAQRSAEVDVLAANSAFRALNEYIISAKNTFSEYFTYVAPEGDINLYYGILCESFDSIHKSLVAAIGSYENEQEFVEVANGFFAVVSELQAALLLTLGERCELFYNIYDNSSSNIVGLLRHIGEILDEAGTWVYVEPTLDVSKYVSAYQKMQHLAVNLQKIDEHLSGTWGSISIYSEIFMQNAGTLIEQFDYIVRELSAKLGISPTPEISDSLCGAAELVTRYNFWLDKIITHLKSIVCKVEANYDVVIPDTVLSYVVQIPQLENIVLETDDHELELIGRDSLPLIAHFKEVVSQIACVLRGKCCAPESYFYSEFSHEFYKLLYFFKTLKSDSITNIDEIVACIDDIKPVPYVAHEIPFALLNQFKALTSKFANVPFPANVEEPHNAARKFTELRRIKEYINSINHHLHIFAQKLSQETLKYEPDMIRFFDAFQSFGRVMLVSLPQEKLPCNSSDDYMFAEPFNTFCCELQGIVALLHNWRCCVNDANKMIALLNSFEGLQLEIKKVLKNNIDNTLSFDPLFSNLLNVFNSIKSHTLSFDSFVNGVKNDLQSFTQSIPSPSYNVSPCETLSFVVHKSRVIMWEISKYFEEILNYWGSHNPTYADDLYQVLVALSNVVIDIRTNLRDIFSKPLGHFSSCSTCIFPSSEAITDLCESLHGQNLTKLASFFFSLRNANVLANQFSLTSVLQQFNDAAASCVPIPLAQVIINETPSDAGTQYNITNTTKADDLLLAWHEGLCYVEAKYQATQFNGNNFVNSIGTFADSLCDRVRTLRTQLAPPLPGGFNFESMPMSKSDSISAMSALVLEFIQKICVNARTFFENYFAQSYSLNPVVEETISQMLRFCDYFVALFTDPTFESQYSFSVETYPEVAFQFWALSEYLRGAFAGYESRCCENNRASGVQRAFTKLTEEISLMADTFEDNSIDGQNYIAAIGVFANSLRGFSTQLDSVVFSLVAPPIDGVLCHYNSGLIAACKDGLEEQCTNIHNISLSVDSGVSTVALQEAWAQNMSADGENLVSFARMFYALKGAPNSLYKSLESIIVYTLSSLHVKHSQTEIKYLQQIKETLEKIKTSLQRFGYDKGRACNLDKYVLIIRDVEQEFDTLALKMNDVIDNIRLRFWMPYALHMRNLCNFIEKFTQELGRFANIELINDELLDADKYSNYGKLVGHLINIYNIISGITPVSIGELLENDTDVAADTVTYMDDFGTFVSGLQSSTIIYNLQGIQDIFGINASTPGSQSVVIVSPIQSIQDDIQSILGYLSSQLTHLDSLARINAGLGHRPTLDWLEKISLILRQNGILAKNIANMFDAYSFVSDKFYADMPKIEKYALGVLSKFDNISAKIKELSLMFDIERCDSLIETYATRLAPQMQKLEHILEALTGDTTNWNDSIWNKLDADVDAGNRSVKLLLQDITQLFGTLATNVSDHYGHLEDKETYCLAGIIEPSLEPIIEKLSALNDLLIPNYQDDFAEINLNSYENHSDALKVVRGRNLAFTQNISNIFTKLTNFVRTNGIRISNQNIQKLERIQGVLLGLYNVLPSVNTAIGEMCSSCPYTDSSEFVDNLRTYIHAVYQNLVTLTDTFRDFCCDANTEDAFVALTYGVCEFVQQLKTSPADVNLLASLGTFIDNLTAPLSAYLLATAHSPTQAEALENLSALLHSSLSSPPSIKEVRIVPFNAMAKTQYVSQIAAHVQTLPHIFSEWNAALQTTTFSLDLNAICAIDTFLHKLPELIELLRKSNPNNSLLHNVDEVVIIRGKLITCLEQSEKELNDLKNTYINSNAEKAALATLSVTQSLVQTFSDIFEFVLAKITGTSNEAIEVLLAQITAKLPNQAAFFPEGVVPPTSLDAPILQLKNAWENAVKDHPVQSFVNICAGITSINACLYTYASNLIDAQGTSPTLPSDDTFPAVVRLVNIATKLNEFVAALVRVSVAVKNIPFDEDYVSQLIRDDGPLMLILGARECIAELAKSFDANPAYHNVEYAHILELLDPVFAKIFVTITDIKDTLKTRDDARTLCLYKNVLNRVWLLSVKMNNVLTNSTLDQAKSFFSKLSEWCKRMTADAGTVAAQVAHLDALLNLVGESFGAEDSSKFIEPSTVDPGPIEGNVDRIKDQIQSEILVIGTTVEGLIQRWLKDPYKLHPELINDVSSVLEQLALLPENLTATIDALQSFVDQLQKPTYCKLPNDVLSGIDADIATSLNAMASISTNIRILDDDALLRTDVSKVAGDLQNIATSLGNLPTVEYFDGDYLSYLGELAVFINSFRVNINSIASTFGSAIPIVNKDEADLCWQSEVFLTRITNNISKLQESFFD
ncbi:MAG: hypothetical protein LBQ43_04820, partial [Holosporales bacterium]|nr:hypothetical protein [Holosporales bacterium]